MSMLGWPSLSAMRPEGGEEGIKKHGRMGKERKEGKEADHDTVTGLQRERST